MQEYGLLVDGNLLLSSKPLEGYKSVEYAPIPEEFDQTTHYIIQTEPVDNGDHIFVGNEMHELLIDEGDNFEEFMPDGIN